MVHFYWGTKMWKDTKIWWEPKRWYERKAKNRLFGKTETIEIKCWNKRAIILLRCHQINKERFSLGTLTELKQKQKLKIFSLISELVVSWVSSLHPHQTHSLQKLFIIIWALKHNYSGKENMSKPILKVPKCNHLFT